MSRLHVPPLTPLPPISRPFLVFGEFNELDNRIIICLFLLDALLGLWYCKPSIYLFYTCPSVKASFNSLFHNVSQETLSTTFQPLASPRLSLHSPSSLSRTRSSCPCRWLFAAIVCPRVGRLLHRRPVLSSCTKNKIRKRKATETPNPCHRLPP